MGFGGGCGTAPAGLNRVEAFGPSQLHEMIPDHLAVNGATHAVTQLHIELGKHIGVEDTRFRNVPDGSGLYYVSNDEFLNGLILGHDRVQFVQ
ncbi:hypothetical protein H920_11661 [Fukomys damarensis]|uniref:Uncharacterized protein n=1 Tax=Fukomys damarensis TaxID=885580 RepID=A0A091D4A5_FUKDA|nr:hypothetical protein H920_11661 [Fukomys damarensis]